MIKHTMDKREELLEELLEGYLFEQNDQSTRNEIAEAVSDVMGFLFTDQTSIEMVDDGYVVVEGFNPETEKMMRVTIQPNK